MKDRFRSAVLMLPVLLGLLFFAGCGRTEPTITMLTITPAPEETADITGFSDGWYGYWTVSEGTGYWDEVTGRSWDCCGEVLTDADGLYLLLWDEDMPRSNHLAKLRMKQENGKCSCTGGDFLDVAVKMEETGFRVLDSQGTLLQITGSFEDDNTGSFCFAIYLRPWGDTWPDTGRRPDGYESWYLQKIKSMDRVPSSVESN